MKVPILMLIKMVKLQFTVILMTKCGFVNFVDSPIIYSYFQKSKVLITKGPLGKSNERTLTTNIFAKKR